jgi:hypothetical protein
VGQVPPFYFPIYGRQRGYKRDNPAFGTACDDDCPPLSHDANQAGASGKKGFGTVGRMYMNRVLLGQERGQDRISHEYTVYIYREFTSRLSPCPNRRKDA